MRRNILATRMMDGAVPAGTAVSEYMRLLQHQTHLVFLPEVYAAIMEAVNEAASGYVEGASGDGAGQQADEGAERSQEADGFRLG